MRYIAQKNTFFLKVYIQFLKEWDGILVAYIRCFKWLIEDEQQMSYANGFVSTKESISIYSSLAVICCM